MRIKVLMTGNDLENMALEAEVLKEHGFLVYTCPNDNAEALLAEINPDVVYLNPQDPNAQSAQLYHNLLQFSSKSRTPVIYALLEDDMYIVSLNHNRRRKVICDNIIDSIKVALHADVNLSSKPRHTSRNIPFTTYSFRA